MTVSIEQVKPGDVLKYWFDTGAFGADLCFARVMKVGKKMIRVRGERGEESWKRPEFFDSVVPEKTVAELLADGVTV